MKDFIPINPEIKGMEVSRSGQIVFLAVFNTATLKSEIVATRFNKSLELIANFDLNFNLHGKPRRIKRIKGTSILMVGLRKDIVIVDFDEAK